MKKLFHRLSSSQSFAKLLSVFAFVAFVSLGALLFPQAVQADDCFFDCPDAGSDPSGNPWGNSPQALDIAYCLDRACVLNLKDGNGQPIFTGNNIPTPHVTHFVIPPVTSENCGTESFSVTISTPGSDYVVALLRDTDGNLIPGTQALASLNIVIKGVTCSSSGNDQILSKVLTLDPNVDDGQPRTDVFDATSHITILPPISNEWVVEGCSPTAGCSFPLGIVEFKTKHDLELELPAVSRVPIVNSYQEGEVYRSVSSTLFFGVRDCKGDPIPGAYDPISGPSTIACSVGGGEGQGLLTFAGSWSGAKGKTINPKSGTGQFDIITPFFDLIVPETVTASANNGPEVPNNGCNDNASQSRERCFFPANALLPNGCTPNQPVAVLVRGKLDIGGTEVGFVSRDNPICNLNK